MNLDIIEYLNSNGIIVGEENFPRIKNKKKESPQLKALLLLQCSIIS